MVVIRVTPGGEPNEPPVWVRRDGAGWVLEFHVQPGTRRPAVGEHGGG
jgi:hypothetical protein